MSMTSEQLKQLDVLVKHDLGMASRGTIVLPTSEVYPNSPMVAPEKVFVKPLPAVAPATSTTELKKYYPVAQGGEGVIRLTREQDIGDGTTWLAFPDWVSFHASGADDGTKNSTIVTDICTSLNGPSFTVMFFLADGTRILPTGEYGPQIQPNAGVVMFAKPLPAGNDGSTVETSPYIQCFQRIGRTVADYDLDSMETGSMVESGSFCTLVEEAFTSL